MQDGRKEQGTGCCLKKMCMTLSVALLMSTILTSSETLLDKRKMTHDMYFVYTKNNTNLVQKKEVCSIQVMCNITKDVNKILKKQSEEIEKQISATDSKFEEIERYRSELQEKFAGLAGNIVQQETDLKMMGDAIIGINTKLTEQIKQMTSTIEKNTNEFTKNLESFQDTQKKQEERTRERGFKIDKIQQDLTKVKEEMAAPGVGSAPKQDTSSSIAVVVKEAKARLKAQLSRSEGKMRETELQVKSWREQLKIQDVKMNAAEFEQAAIAVKIKENEGKIDDAKAEIDLIQTQVTRRDEALATLVSHEVDTKAAIMKSGTDMNILEGDMEFTTQNIAKLNERISDIQGTLLAADQKFDAQDASPAKTEPPSPPCPKGYFKTVLDLPELDSYSITCRNMAGEEIRLAKKINQEDPDIEPLDMAFL